MFATLLLIRNLACLCRVTNFQTNIQSLLRLIRNKFLYYCNSLRTSKKLGMLKRRVRTPRELARAIRNWKRFAGVNDESSS